jgi:hypothetical protein
VEGLSIEVMTLTVPTCPVGRPFLHPRELVEDIIEVVFGHITTTPNMQMLYGLIDECHLLCLVVEVELLVEEGIEPQVGTVRLVPEVQPVVGDSDTDLGVSIQTKTSVQRVLKSPSVFTDGASDCTKSVIGQ